MIGLKIAGSRSNFSDDDSCLEWLKNQIFPHGIKCEVCNRITKHHKIKGRRCYACDNCRHQVYPTAGTMFHKSTIPLKTWFDIIRKISNSGKNISSPVIARKYGITHSSASRLIQKIEDDFLNHSIKYIPDLKKSSVNKIPQSSNISSAASNVNLDSPVQSLNNLTFYDDRLSDRSKSFNQHEIQQKRDRTARLLKLQILLWQNPEGLTIKELADRCSINKRTIYRDLRALESELEVPIWEQGHKRGIVEGYYLPPISFTPSEANIIFLAARLMQQITFAYDPNVISTLIKLNTVVSQNLRKQIRKTLDYMELQPRDSRVANNFNKLVEAWISQHKVKLIYQNLVDEQDPVERIIEPYFVEPSSIGGTSYVLAYCHYKKRVCAFAISYIIGSVKIEPETFDIPDDFDAISYLSSAWGIYSESKEIESVKLHFKANISKSISDMKIHPSQKTEVLKDGSIILTLKVRDTIQFFGWILAWRGKVEVLEPESMRNEICLLAESLLHRYKSEDTTFIPHL
jgi:predicted DNA-binding transcriptional regulator YafY